MRSWARLIMVGIASLISIPIGIVAAIYLAEYGKKSWFAQLIRFLTDVMTGVPSVFVGLFVYTALVIQFGFGAFLGGLALAIIMLPIIVRSTEEMLKLVPGDLKNAGYALGAAKWQVVIFVTLPSALPGITTGVMLAVARAAGETAPLILTALGAQALVTKLDSRADLGPSAGHLQRSPPTVPRRSGNGMGGRAGAGDHRPVVHVARPVGGIEE